MCYRPIHIYNPSRRWNGDAPLRVAVPCGNCEDCRRVKRNEWFFRSVIEYNHYVNDLKGSVYFVTLTYSNENLPYIELPNGEFVSAFNRFHIRNFIKYIRVYLKRKHILSTDIKFLICTEYSDKNTCRPHYHGLLFFPFTLSEFQFTQLMRRCWQHGFVVCSREGWRVNSVAGIRYATKYICKDMSFVNQPWARRYLRDKRFQDWKESVKDFLPKHWQSAGFGEKFCEYINSQSDIPAFLARNKFSLCVGATNNFPIPRYYHLKFEKVINKEYSKMLGKVVIEPTEIGLEVKRLRLSEAIIKDVSNLKIINKESLERDLPKVSEFQSYFAQYKDRHPDNFNFYSKCAANLSITDEFDYSYFRNEIIDTLPKLLNSLGYFNVSAYRLFLRYYPCYEDEDPSHKFAEITDIICNQIANDNNVFPPEYKGVIEMDSYGNVFATPLVDNPEYKLTPTCSSNPYFLSFEICAGLLDITSFIRGLNKDYKLITKENEKRSCKDSRPDDSITYQSLIS